MSKQLGPCAISAACCFPGPRVSIRGTNQTVCPVHARMIQSRERAGGGDGSEAQAMQFAVPRPRRNWATEW